MPGPVLPPCENGEIPLEEAGGLLHERIVPEPAVWGVDLCIDPFLGDFDSWT